MIQEHKILSASNKILEAFIHNMPVGIIVIDKTNTIKMTNQLANKYLELNNQNRLKEESDILEVIKHIPDLYTILKRNLDKKKSPFTIESLFHKNKYLSINGRLIPSGYIVIVEDISKQKDIEVNSIQAILERQENERRRIGREIHDGIGPLLSFMKLSLDSFADDLHQQNPDIATETLDNISETIDSITDDLRALSHRLVPRLLDEFGLNPAFKNLIYRLNDSKKANIKFYTNIEKEKRFNNDIELNIFRCGQELLNNAVKYSKANNILIQVILHKESIVLMVEDNGVGFQKDNLLPDNYGIGLTNIGTRVRVLNGEFNIESSVGKGTVASIEIPI